MNSALALLRELRAALPARTRQALVYDIASGICSGAYIGCTWTFVQRIARADIGATAAQIGWINAAPAIGYLFASVWARQMEGRGKLPFVWVTWFVARGLFVLSPLVATRDQYVLLVCLAPIIFSISTPAYAAIMKDIYPDSLRGRLMSAVRILQSVAMLGTAFAAGRLLDAGWSWKTMFAIGGVLGILSAVTFWRIPVSSERVENGERPSTGAFVLDTLAILRHNVGFRWFCASVFVYGFGNIMASTIYPIFQVDELRVTNTEVANMQNLASVAQVAGFFVWGALMDRKGPLMAVFVSVAIVSVMPLCYAVATSIGLLYLASVAGGLAMSGIELGYLNTTLLFAEHGRAAQYQALHSSLFGIRGTVAPLLAIPLMHWLQPRGAFLFCFGIMLVGVGLQVLSMRHYLRSAARARAV
jgi:hypothetical protein